MAHRYVVVVPANAPETLAYLTESFKNVPDVEIVVERRKPRPTSAAPSVERRASDASRRIQEAFGCTLVRIEPPAPEPTTLPETSAPPKAVAPPTNVLPFTPVRLRTLPLLQEG